MRVWGEKEEKIKSVDKREHWVAAVPFSPHALLWCPITVVFPQFYWESRDPPYKCGKSMNEKISKRSESEAVNRIYSFGGVVINFPVYPHSTICQYIISSSLFTITIEVF